MTPSTSRHVFLFIGLAAIDAAAVLSDEPNNLLAKSLIFERAKSKCCVCQEKLRDMCTIDAVSEGYGGNGCDSKCVKENAQYKKTGSKLLEVTQYKKWGKCSKENARYNYGCQKEESVQCKDTVFHHGSDDLEAPKLLMCGVQQMSSQTGDLGELAEDLDMLDPPALVDVQPLAEVPLEVPLENSEDGGGSEDAGRPRTPLKYDAFLRCMKNPDCRKAMIRTADPYSHSGSTEQTRMAKGMPPSMAELFVDNAWEVDDPAARWLGDVHGDLPTYSRLDLTEDPSDQTCKLTFEEEGLVPSRTDALFPLENVGVCDLKVAMVNANKGNKVDKPDAIDAVKGDLTLRDADLACMCEQEAPIFLNGIAQSMVGFGGGLGRLVGAVTNLITANRAGRETRGDGLGTKADKKIAAFVGGKTPTLAKAVQEADPDQWVRNKETEIYIQGNTKYNDATNAFAPSRLVVEALLRKDSEWSLTVKKKDSHQKITTDTRKTAKAAITEELKIVGGHNDLKGTVVSTMTLEKAGCRARTVQCACSHLDVNVDEQDTQVKEAVKLMAVDERDPEENSLWTGDFNLRLPSGDVETVLNRFPQFLEPTVLDDPARFAEPSAIVIRAQDLLKPSENMEKCYSHARGKDGSLKSKKRGKDLIVCETGWLDRAIYRFAANKDNKFLGGYTIPGDLTGDHSTKIFAFLIKG